MTAATERPSRAQIWWQAIRPATLWAAVGPVAVGTAVAVRDGVARPLAAGAALAGAVLIQIGTNLFNDWADFEKGADGDDRVGPARATQKGWLTAREVLGGAAVALGLATMCGTYLVAIAGWPILVLGVASLACAILYTGGPAPLAYVGLGDVFVFAFFGVAAVCGTYFVQAGRVTAEVLAASLAVGALATAILVVNNLRDRHTDARAGKRTVVVRFGENFGRVEYVALVAGAYLAPVGLFVTRRRLGWLAPLATAPLAAGTIRRVLSRDGADLNPELGATARLGLLFSAAWTLGVPWT